MAARTVAEIQERRRILRDDFIGCPRPERCARPCGECITISMVDLLSGSA